MIGPIVLLALLALGARAIYPPILERRAMRRRAVGTDGIVQGAAPIVKERLGAPGVLLLHGGGDTPQVIAQLAEHLFAAGFSVRAPLLPGHGRNLAALRTVAAQDLWEFVQAEYESLERKHPGSAVVGLSMGGALAIRLAAQRQVSSLVLLAPYVDMPAAIRRLAATAGMWGWLLPYFSSRGGRSIRDPGAAAQALGHGILTPAMLRALHEVVDEARRALPGVQAPTLVIQSREDNRISVRSAEHAFQLLGSREKRFVWTDGAGHVITVDYGRERVFALCAEWLSAHPHDGGAARGQAGPPVR